MDPRLSHTDILIIGAGLSGLRTATLLVEQGLSVRVLEAADRVGGRTLEKFTDDGDVLHFGGTWCGTNQPRINALIRTLGLETVAQVDEGRISLQRDGKLFEATDPEELFWVGPYPVPRQALLPGFQEALATLGALSADIARDAPYTHPRALEWDSLSAADWVNGLDVSEACRRLLRGYLEAELWIELEELSFFFLLFNWTTVTDWMEGEQRIRGGTQTISRRMAENLGDRILLNHPVSALRQEENGVAVTAGGKAYSARYAVVTLMPGLCDRIDWSPPLPADRAACHARLRFGKVVRINLVYDRPFWRENGQSGVLLSIDGPVEGAVDCSVDPDGPGILNVFVSGRHVEPWLKNTDTTRRTAVLQQLESVFGPEAGHPKGYHQHNWNDEPWIGGGHCGVAPPGLLAANGAALRTPVGRIHWAGSETARKWYGWLEGALESAERVTEEILDRMK